MNKDAKILQSESCGVGLLIWHIIAQFIAIFFITLVLALLNIIPILGTILFMILSSINGIIFMIDTILMIIGSIRSKATLTEEGIYGNSYYFGTFDLSFNQITSISIRKKLITIEYVAEGGKTKKVKIYGISNAKTFYKACNEQMVAFRTASAQAEAEVQA